MNNDSPEDKYQAFDDEDIDAVLTGVFEISLSRNEALYLDDCLSLMIERDISDHGMPLTSTMRQVMPSAQLGVPIELIDKIALAVLHTTDPVNMGLEYTLKLIASELYLLREVSQSYIKIGQEPVGFNLKRKIYKTLFQNQYDAGQQLAKLLGEENTLESDIQTVIKNLGEHTD